MLSSAAVVWFAPFIERLAVFMVYHTTAKQGSYTMSKPLHPHNIINFF